MESIKELRVKLQTDVLGHPILQRKLSIYITRLLLPTRVSSIQVSVAMILVGVLSGIVISIGFIWTGILLMYFSIILDAVDGEVVRYKKNFSVRGVYLDLVNHLVVQEMFFLGLTLWVSEIWSTPNIFVLISGVLGALTMSIRRANGDIHRVLFVRPYSRNPQMFALPSLQPKAQPKAKEDTKKSFLSTTVVLIKKGLYEIHESAFMLIAVAVVYAGELLFFPNIPHYPLLSWTIIFFGATSCAYLVKEIIGNFYSMETKIALIENDFKSIHQ